MKITKYHAVLVFLLLSILSFTTTEAQQKNYSEKDYRKSPVWIQLMDDEQVNFFEVQKAFEIYWKEREMPKEEEEIIGQKFASDSERKSKETWLKKLFGDKREIDESKMAFAVKRYRFWCLNMSPWVQEDGSILSAEKRLEIMQTVRKP